MIESSGITLGVSRKSTRRAVNVFVLICSPKSGPDVMRVLSGREPGKDCHETQTSSTRTDRRAAA